MEGEGVAQVYTGACTPVEQSQERKRPRTRLVQSCVKTSRPLDRMVMSSAAHFSAVVLLAATLSAMLAVLPVPISVVTIPVEITICRIRTLPRSLTYSSRCPVSYAIRTGSVNCASRAWPQSPEKPAEPVTPAKFTMVMLG